MFIVIEGLDGAGKSTQVKLMRRLFEERYRQHVEYLHFPRFDAPLYGELIARFLRGELGALDQVDPYLVALLYAGDRQEAASIIRNWLDDNKVVIVDRYVYSNIAYQCAKLPKDSDARSALKQWILDLEYRHNGIPKPDLSLFLDVPFAFTARKLAEQRQGDDRNYLNGKQDIHESSLDLQQRVREVYLDCAADDPAFRIIDCADPATGGMLNPDLIFQKIDHEIARHR